MPLKKTFRLSRTLKVGMEGEDVKKFQKWLNIVNLSYGFSKLFPDGIAENGRFTTFITLAFYHEWSRWSMDEQVRHTYDKDAHEWLCLDVNMGMQNMLNDFGTKWVTS